MSIQAEILTLLQDIQRDEGLSMLFITHDLRVAARVADEIIVMQSGRIVEQGSMAQVLTTPQHEYTAALINAVPHFSGTKSGSTQSSKLEKSV